MAMISLLEVQRRLSEHVPLYAWHRPVYQHVMLEDLNQLWDPSHRSMLDVGGGTGAMAQVIKSLFGLERVAAVDIETAIYDGGTLPYADDSFDCVLLLNVMHHVPRMARERLVRECRRVAGDGPIYID